MAGEIQLNSISFATESGGTITLNSSVDIKGNLNATGSAPVYACRAWVNFNGTSTVAIRESGNVSSITDNGTGQYTVNFATAMPDANYSVTMGGEITFGGSVFSGNGITAYSNWSSSSCKVRFVSGSGTYWDPEVCCVAIHR